MLLRAFLFPLALVLLGGCASGALRPIEPPGPHGPDAPGRKGAAEPAKEPGRKPAPGDRREPSLLEPPTSAPGVPAEPSVIRSAEQARAPGDHAEPPVFEVFAQPLVRFVDAARGLYLRAAADAHSGVVAVLEHRTEVRVVGRRLIPVVMGGKSGRWVQVEAQGQRGWVFDAFLTVDAPPVLLEEDFRRLFAATSFRSRLIAMDGEGERFLGGFTKKAGATAFRVATLTRLCGKGEADRELHMNAEAASFAVGYRWCSVDPGDIVRTMCVQCHLVRYRCELTATELRAAGTAGGVYEKPITCVRDAATFCRKDCDSMSPLRDVETPR